MNEIKIFEGTQVHIIEKDGEPMFEVYSTGMALGQVKFNSVGTAYPRKDRIDENLKNAEIIPCVHNGHSYITEEQLYDLMLEMKTDKVKPFRKWVTSEVLPSLRKYGKYSMVKKPDSYMIEDEIERAKRWIEEAEERRQLAITVKEQEETIEKQQPLVDFAKTVAGSEDCIDMNSMAKLIYKETGIRIGRNKLFEILRKNKILMFNNQPYQRYIADGTFKLNEKPYKDCDGETRLSIKTLVTGKGQIKLCKFIQKKYYNE